MITVDLHTDGTEPGRPRERALALAEAGLNNALARLYNAADPSSPSALTAGSRSKNGGTEPGQGRCPGSTWTLTGTGTIPSPIAGGGTVRRTASVDVQVNGMSAAWQYLYADNAAGCMNISNNATISAPVYSRGGLCISNNAHVTGSPVQVEGNVTIGNNGSIGSAGSPVAVANLASCGEPGACLLGGRPRLRRPRCPRRRRRSPSRPSIWPAPTRTRRPARATPARPVPSPAGSTTTGR